MTVFVCADDRNGILFNNRRLSRDSELCQRVLDFCGGKKLWMNGYSATIFPGNVPNIRVCENFSGKVGAGEFCFVEKEEDLSIISRANTLVVYRWNRSYPADVRIPAGLLEAEHLVSRTDFPGKSHPCITEEVYKL